LNITSGRYAGRPSLAAYTCATSRSSARQSISAAICSNRALRPLPPTILCSAKLRCRASFRHILTPPPPPPLFLIIPAQVMQRSLVQGEGKLAQRARVRSLPATRLRGRVEAGNLL